MSDRTELPAGLEYVRTTAVMDEREHPAGLGRAHRVADGVWALLKVQSGQLGFVFEDQPDERLTVSAGESLAIPPARRHHVEFDGQATFAIEFYRQPTLDTPDPGTESTGLATE